MTGTGLRILFYGINYAPEPTGIGKYSGEMCAWLAARGHRVHVVTAPPYYPWWAIQQGWRNFYATKQETPNLSVTRCPLYVPRQPNGKKRLLHLMSFALSAGPVVLSHALRFKPDLVMGVEPTLATAPVLHWTARGAHARSWLHVQDFEVDAAFALGLLGGSGGAWHRRALAYEARLMRRFDRVSTISGRMQQGLAQKGVTPGQAYLLRNWVDCREIFPLPHPSPLRAQLGIADDKIVALYSGNMGEKQGLETLAELAHGVTPDGHIALVFCGAGAARARLEQATRTLSHVHWLDLQPVERLNELLNLADIHLLPQRADAADLVMPSKLTGMLASGRPVIAGAAAGTELASAVEGSGFAVTAGDAQAMVEKLRLLAQDGPLRRQMGKTARDRALGDWDRDAILARFEREILRLCRPHLQPLANKEP